MFVGFESCQIWQQDVGVFSFNEGMVTISGVVV